MEGERAECGAGSPHGLTVLQDASSHYHPGSLEEVSEVNKEEEGLVAT